MDQETELELEAAEDEEIAAMDKEKIAILCHRGEDAGALFVVDEILQQMDVVIKHFRSKFTTFQEILGVSITGDGSICLLLDVFNIISSISQELKTLQLIEKE